MNIKQLFQDKRILVIGDVCLDRYVRGVHERNSQESGTPVVHVVKSYIRLGMAANVSKQIKALGGIPITISVAGMDSAGYKLRHKMEIELGEQTTLLLDSKRKTTIKTRIIQDSKQVLRLDSESITPIEKQFEQEILKKIERLDSYDAVILQDYAKGVLSSELCQYICDYCKYHKKPVFVDPNKNVHYPKYQQAYAICPNFSELRALGGYEGTPSMAAKNLQELAQIEHVIVTKGDYGISVYSKDSNYPFEIDATERKSVDVTGAGDTVVAVLALATAAGIEINQAAALANIAGGVVVEKFGTSICTLKELQAGLRL